MQALFSLLEEDVSILSYGGNLNKEACSYSCCAGNGAMPNLFACRAITNRVAGRYPPMEGASEGFRKPSSSRQLQRVRVVPQLPIVLFQRGFFGLPALFLFGSLLAGSRTVSPNHSRNSFLIASNRSSAADPRRLRTTRWLALLKALANLHLREAKSSERARSICR